MLADLSIQADVRALAAQVRERFPRLDVLINNAGAMFDPSRESVDGIEMTWALNHLAYFLLTNLLLDTLKASAPARIVNVASDAHQMARRIDFDDSEGKKRYKPFRAYAQSKLANILFTIELARRLEETGVTANCLHPGFVATNFTTGSGLLFWVMRQAARIMAISPEAGAADDDLPGHVSRSRGRLRRLLRQAESATPTAAARDPEAARRLWRLSEEMTGLSPST